MKQQLKTSSFSSTFLTLYRTHSKTLQWSFFFFLIFRFCSLAKIKMKFFGAACIQHTQVLLLNPKKPVMERKKNNTNRQFFAYFGLTWFSAYNFRTIVYVFINHIKWIFRLSFDFMLNVLTKCANFHLITYKHAFFFCVFLSIVAVTVRDYLTNLNVSFAICMCNSQQNVCKYIYE